MSRRVRPFVVLSLVLLLCACFGPRPSSVVRTFYEDVANGKLDDAVGLVSDQIVTLVGPKKLRAGLEAQTRKMMAMQGLKEVSVVDEKIAGDVATVTVVVKFGNGTSRNESIDLVKEKGQWKLKPKK